MQVDCQNFIHKFDVSISNTYQMFQQISSYIKPRFHQSDATQ